MSKVHASTNNVRKHVCEILDCDNEELVAMARPGYSGRGMFGNQSSFAFDCDVDPRSREGHALQALGLQCDNMGRGYIYYTKD